MSKTFWRRGIAASEFAVLAPFLVLVVFGASMLGLIGDFMGEIFQRIAETGR